MTSVKHMKWWGWGVDGVGFHYEDKPGFAPFVLQAVGLDLLTAERAGEPAFADLKVPKSNATAAFTKTLAGIVGADNVSTDDMLRVIHTYGKSLRDLVRIRGNMIKRSPDVVVYPADEAEVQQVVDAAVAANAVIIPFGGGSNIASSLEPLPEEKRTIISLDLGRLRKVIDIDADSGLARIEAGAQGPDLEEQLNKQGWTIGHFPDSFTHSTVGGWVATRSSGMQSDKYGDIADIARGLRVVRPGGVLVLRPLPSTSSGPSVREMILGSEGRLGVITEVTVQVHRVPAKRDVYAYFFPNWKSGIAAMQEISESDAAPSITRISDARETGFSLATSKDRKGFDKFLAGTVLPGLMKSKGWTLEDICLSFIGYEGSVSHAKRQKKLVDAIVKKHGGMGVGTGPGILYDQKKFDTPYLRDFLLDMGAAGDVSETAAPWSKLVALHEAVYAAANKAYDEIGIKGWIMSHLSHSYHSGACLYFTFAFVFDKDPIGEYDRVKSAIQQAFVDNHGTISHHHGVGLEHAPWLEQDISVEGVKVMRGLVGAADPKKNFNPGKIFAD
ncbi:MAG: FAD-binding oxidoreductase [Microbacteriaceae bacterium]|jgi:alkyldihydroxyacetonephosphate synthase|nr:FAD-binding oxidoreductase [Microbacteriaceae bacterium]HOB56466.1 FAD-binding oxidoreductase [Rhodoglobus sp.]HOW01108.1 FAD-binding oxidoreductase [Rhodoglobus sp.]HOY81664.1 FAD-binding oxidoreductase [Rhodoglobus sp.]HPG76060.1 FAD-binding oxidoreductase [Rhodoglobus sp.]